MALEGDLEQVGWWKKKLPGYSPQTYKSLTQVAEDVINYDLITALVAHISAECEEGAILIFLPGLAEITRCYEDLLGASQVGYGHGESPLMLFPLHSSLSTSENGSCAAPRPLPARRAPHTRRHARVVHQHARCEPRMHRARAAHAPRTPGPRALRPTLHRPARVRAEGASTSNLRLPSCSSSSWTRPLALACPGLRTRLPPSAAPIMSSSAPRLAFAMIAFLMHVKVPHGPTRTHQQFVGTKPATASCNISFKNDGGHGCGPTGSAGGGGGQGGCAARVTPCACMRQQPCVLLLPPPDHFSLVSTQCCGNPRLPLNNYNFLVQRVNVAK